MTPVPRNLLEIVTWKEAFLFGCHLANENSLDWYGIEQLGSNGPMFRWGLMIQPYVAIAASLRTAANLARPGHHVSFVPFCCNTWRYRSRWAALRIGLGDADADTIRRRALEAFCRLQELAPRMCCILEATGANTWQIWAIANGYRSWSEWSTLLAKVVSRANLDDPAVRYDSFPSPAALLKPRMLGLRAPGSWNPATDTVAAIHHHNLGPLTARLLRACR
jgi:hypothetical protein